jgi:hypothetical protein
MKPSSYRLDLLMNGRLLGRKAGPPLVGNASAPLKIESLLLRTQVTSRKQVELIFLLVHGAVEKVEDDTGDERDDGHTAIVPHEMGVVGQWGEGLGQRSGEGSGEEPDGLDEGAHVLGRLGEGVLERGDGGEDLGNGNEDIDTGYGPDSNVGLVFGVVRLVVA